MMSLTMGFPIGGSPIITPKDKRRNKIKQEVQHHNKKLKIQRIQRKNVTQT